MELSRVAWKDKITGVKGEGTWREYSLNPLKAAVITLNYYNQTIYHWVETWTRRGN